MKICTKCKVEKPLSEFHKWASTTDGYQYNCKACKAAYRKKLDQQPHNLERTRAYHFKYKYGITVEQYDDMLAAQGGVCAICKQPERHKSRSGKITPLAVDHCHSTGRIRGLLCHYCNVSLGAMNDSIERLESAIDYLREKGVD